jgi:hypothetical protein
MSREGGCAGVRKVCAAESVGLSALRLRVEKIIRKVQWGVAATVARDPARARIVARLAKPRGYVGPDLTVRAIEGTALIEPEWGYVIGGRGRLFEDTMRTNIGVGTPWRIALPSPGSFYSAREDGRRQRRYETVISLRHWWEWNYYHFHLDVLGKLPALEDAGIDVQNTPIVLGRYAMELPWASQIITTGALAQYSWVIQDHFYVRAERVIYCQGRVSYLRRAAFIADKMWNESPRPHGPGQRRLFLNRRRASTRRVVNYKEVLSSLHDRGFEEVDTDGMTIGQQMELFADARYIVGIHGAGLTNIIHRRGGRLAVLELHPRTYWTSDYKNICEELGYKWDHLPSESSGSRIPQHSDMLVDVSRLDSHVAEMLKEESRPTSDSA